MSEPQKHPPSAAAESRQAPLASSPHTVDWPKQKQLVHAGDAAKAGVLRLVRMGADQAMAAPAPIRLSILLREML